ncbi:hypothetical protein PanWU01x14_251740 [Parasponia andersonii]|uniref:Uncharacterized protein n=1 Tax=Parasponia andersonii TaxID=3476 RepID=A0A2P5BCD9_PARAD|nr:hypothetical protein PanWU01x14_251740 [Parasponia andersonii]
MKDCEDIEGGIRSYSLVKEEKSDIYIINQLLRAEVTFQRPSKRDWILGGTRGEEITGKSLEGTMGNGSLEERVSQPSKKISYFSRRTAEEPGYSQSFLTPKVSGSQGGHGYGDSGLGSSSSYPSPRRSNKGKGKLTGQAYAFTGTDDT